MLLLLLAGKKSGLGGQYLPSSRQDPATAHTAAASAPASRGQEYLVGSQRCEQRGPGWRLDRTLAVDRDTAVTGRHKAGFGHQQDDNQQQCERPKYDNRRHDGEVAEREYYSGHNRSVFTV